MSKKILVICQRFWPEKQKINDICKGFLERGFKVDVLCGKPNYPDGNYYRGYSAFSPKEENGPGLHIYRAFEIRKGAGSGLNIFLNYLSFSISSRITALKLLRNSYDRVFIYQLSPITMAAPGFIVAKRLKKPVTMYAIDIWPESIIRELDIQSSLLKKILTATAEKHYRNADRLITATERSYEYMTGQLKIPAKRVTKIPLCPDEGSLEGIRDIDMMEKYAGSFNILFVGSADEEHDLETVLDAAQRLMESGIRDIRFIIAGYGSSLGRLKKSASKKQLHDVVFFENAGDAEDQLKLFYVADVMLTCPRPSRTGEFYSPVELNDVMGAGKPVISTMSSEGRNIINKAKCGYIYEAGNSDSLMEIILRLYHSPREKLLEMGHRAAGYQKEYLDRDTNIGMILETMFAENDLPDNGGFAGDDDDEVIILKGNPDKE